MTPPNNHNQNDKEVPSVASLLNNSFESYEAMIDRYAELLKETNSLSTIIKDKIMTLATLEQLNTKVESVNSLIGVKMDTFNETAKIKVETANKEAETSKKSLDETVRTLTFRLNLVIAVLIAIFTIGGIAFTYIRIILDAKIAKQTETIIESRGQINQSGVVPYWIDKEGKKNYIMMEKQQPDRAHPENQPAGTQTPATNK